jgi:hypothetical protein
VHLVPRHVFDAIMATVLAILSVVVIRLRPHAQRGVPRGATTARELIDAHGEVYRYRVPLMAGALGFPTHVATATSHFVLVWMSGTASATHLIGGTLTVGHGLRRAIALSIGVLPGAQLGARLSRRFTGPTIRKFLGVALLGLAVRLLISALP